MSIVSLTLYVLWFIGSEGLQKNKNKNRKEIVQFLTIKDINTEFAKMHLLLYISQFLY